MGHLARAEQLKTAIKWNDVKVIHPSGTPSDASGDTMPDPSHKMEDAQSAMNDQDSYEKQKRLEASNGGSTPLPQQPGDGPEPGAHQLEPEVNEKGMPGATLIAAGFAPGWIHRRRASRCRVQQEGAR